VTIFILILSVIVLAIIVLVVIAKYELLEKSPLHKAIKRHRTQEALALIKQGTDINLRNNLQETPLICAAFAGDVEVAKVLVESGADVNAQSLPTRFTALLWAAQKGSADIVRLLVEAGAEVNARDWDENTPLMQAASHSGSPKVAADLLAAGADISAKNKDGKTALTSAILSKNADIARTLIKAGAEVNGIDDRGQSALHLLLNTQQYATAEALFDDLMSAGLDIHAKARGDVTVLMTAVSTAIRENAKGNHPLLNITRKLVRDGADVDAALAIAQMHKADAPEFFDGHITGVIEILTSR
jgi:uncharacterized protein